jgi:ribosomal protein S27AE
MPENDKMKCPYCGAEMNHHADKIVYDAAHDGGADADESGVILEAHTCPRCGRSATRARGAASGE